MNTYRLPHSPRDTVPAVIDPGGRAIDFPYRGGPAPDFEPRESSLRTTFFKYLNLAIRHRILIGCFCAVALAGGLVVTLMTPKRYSASTTVKIDRAAPKFLKESSVQVDSSGDSQFYQTQYELIKSRSLAEQVAKALDLGRTNFVEGGEPSLWERMTTAVSFASAEQAKARDDKRLEDLQDAAAGKIQAGLSILPVAMSSLVRIKYTSEDPRWARDISIAVAEGYERSTLDRRFNASKHARKFLEERLQELKLKLQASEQQLIAYAQKEGIVNVDDKQPQAATSLSTVYTALSDATMERIKSQQLWDQAKSDPSGLSLPQVMSNGIVQNARERLATLKATYQDKLNVLRPAYPEMQALRTQIGENERQIRAQVDLVKNSVKAQYEAALSQEKALREKLEQVKTEVLEARGRSVEYTILNREVDTARSLYDGLLQQYRELAVSGDVDTNNVSIIDKAQMPWAPDSPSLSKNLLVSLMLGMMGAAGVIFLREALDDTFKTVEDVEDGLGLAVLGVAPSFENAPGKGSPIREVMNDPRSSLSEAFRSLRTALQFSTEEGTPKTLLVTSATPGEGKSTTSAALAVHFSELGMRVLLIDADMRNPNMHELVETENEAGLSTFLSGATDASHLVTYCAIETVTFMSAGPVPANPGELLARPRFASLLATASEAFDIIIIDGPPVLGLADVPIISSMVSGTLLVVEAAHTRRSTVRDAIKRMDFARARLVGVLLNKFDPGKAGSKYGNGYAYGDDAYYSYGRDEKTPRLTGT